MAKKPTPAAAAPEAAAAPAGPAAPTRPFSIEQCSLTTTFPGHQVAVTCVCPDGEVFTVHARDPQRARELVARCLVEPVA